VIRFLLLDSGPLGLLTHPRRSAEVVAINDWLLRCLLHDVQVFVPAIVYYELRRELLRADKVSSLARLDVFVHSNPGRYLFLTDEALHLGAELWAKARRAGRPTAARDALDVDVLIAAQAVSLGAHSSEIIIATSNRKHLSQYLAAADWTEIPFENYR